MPYRRPKGNIVLCESGNDPTRKRRFSSQMELCTVCLTLADDSTSPLLGKFIAMKHQMKSSGYHILNTKHRGASPACSKAWMTSAVALIHMLMGMGQEKLKNWDFYSLLYRRKSSVVPQEVHASITKRELPLPPLKKPLSRHLDHSRNYIITVSAATVRTESDSGGGQMTVTLMS